MKYYHATDSKNVESILKEGVHTGIDNCVYMTRKAEEATRFLVLRPNIEKIAVIEINIPKECRQRLQESFDHNQAFFGCKAYIYLENVPAEWCSLKDIYVRGNK